MVGLKCKHISLTNEEEDDVISFIMKKDDYGAMKNHGVVHSSQSLSIHVNNDYIFSNKFHVNDEDSEFLIMNYPKSQPLNHEQVLETSKVDSSRKHYKGNHDDLKMKVDELEKLFADHKLRINGSVRRIDAISFVNVNGDDDDYYGDDCRGKYYDKYMKKRDAKLREDWSMKREEKEARMKAMQDSFDQNSAEMKEKFSCSYHSHKFTSLKSFVKREQYRIDSIQNEDVGDVSELLEEKIYEQDSIVSESTFGDCAARQSKKNLPNKQVSAATSSTTKPSFGMSKTNQYRLRNYARSRSTLEGMEGIKEVKQKRTQSLRKSTSANPAEFYDLAPLKFYMEQTDLNHYDRSRRPFAEKGYSLGPDASGSATRMISSTKENEEFDELELEVEDSLDIAKEEQKEEIETFAIVDHVYTNNGMVRLSQECEKSVNSGSEIGDSTRSLSQVEHALVAEMPNVMHDSPVESPVLWNSHMQHSFSYPNESSDIDASVDSPSGSPVSRNSRSLIQGETDATAQMKKKSGSAQKKVIVVNSSISQPCKDVAKGFKRLLKFGRKNRASESLIEGDDKTEDRRDLANRSSEDLRKSTIRFSHAHPSDNSFNENELLNEQVQSLRSSIPAPPANFKLRDDHISGSSLKAPRSCFSLSSFRSKGCDTKTG